MSFLKKENRHWIYIKCVLFGILLIALGFETKDHVEKYFSGKTGQSVTLEHVKTLELPAITLCASPSIKPKPEVEADSVNYFQMEYLFSLYLSNKTEFQDDPHNFSTLFNHSSNHSGN